MSSGAPDEIVGVVGSPIAHSLSPLLHAAAFDALGINWASARFEAGVGQGHAVVEAVRSLGLRGLSVTMPLKTEVAHAVDVLAPSAASIESVNTLVQSDGTVEGHSTDGAGLYESLKRQSGFDVSSARVLVLGAGGAARAVVAAAHARGASEISVIARSARSARSAADLAGSVGRVGTVAEAPLADLVVNATPIGMSGTEHEATVPLVDAALLHGGQVVTDLVYRPLETAWLRAARDNGATVVGGLGMLIHQAAIAIEHWTGFDAPIEAMYDAASATLESSPW